MSIYMEYENSLDREYDILMRRFEIATERAEAIYAYESFIDNNLDDKYITEANKSYIPEEEANVDQAEGEGEKPAKAKKSINVGNVKNAFKNFIDKIVSYIKTLINDVAEMFENMFSKGDNLDLETYLKSDTGKERFDYDCVDIELQVADEVRKGRKLIQAISRGTNIDDATVEHYVDKGADFAMKNKEMVIAVPVALALWKKGVKKSKDVAKDVDAAGDAAKKVTNPEDQKKVKKIFSAMQRKIKVGNDALRGYGSKLANRAKNAKNKKNENKSENN